MTDKHRREVDERDLAWLNDARRALSSTGCKVQATSSIRPVEHGVEFELTVFAPNRSAGLKGDSNAGEADTEVTVSDLQTRHADDDSGGDDS